MVTFRDMQLGDLSKVIKIIEAYDDDDAEAAEASFESRDFEHQFVMEQDDKVIGVTGFNPVPVTDRTAWLSWTYLDKTLRGQGLGRKLVEHVIAKAKEWGCRKLFVKISNYESPEDGPVYQAAYSLYTSLGFNLEVINPDFYDDGEDLHILGLVLDETAEDVDILEEKPIIQFKKMFELAESDGAYGFTWEAEEKKLFSSSKHFTVLDLKIGIDAVNNQGGRKIFLVFPSNLPLIIKPLQGAGFELLGQLSDYYEQGLHELHFAYDLKQP